MDEAAKNALVIIALLFTLVLLKASVIAFATSYRFARPELCERIYAAYQEHPRRATLIGLVNTLVLGFIGLALLNSQPLGLLGLLVLAGLCTTHIIGRTACYRKTAANIYCAEGSPADLASTIRAAILTELSFLVPVAGQLLYLVVTTRCAGACFMALVARGKSAPANADKPVE